MKRNKKLTADIILIALFLLSGLSLLLFGRRMKTAGTYAVVSVNGIEQERYNLSTNGIFSLNGGTNVLIIENGTARINDADCPDRLCVKQGRISYTSQCITCLPNKLTVTIEGPEKDVDFVI